MCDWGIFENVPKEPFLAKIIVIHKCVTISEVSEKCDCRKWMETKTKHKKGTKAKKVYEKNKQQYK